MKLIGKIIKNYLVFVLLGTFAASAVPGQPEPDYSNLSKSCVADMEFVKAMFQLKGKFPFEVVQNMVKSNLSDQLSPEKKEAYLFLVSAVYVLKFDDPRLYQVRENQYITWMKPNMPGCVGGV